MAPFFLPSGRRTARLSRSTVSAASGKPAYLTRLHPILPSLTWRALTRLAMLLLAAGGFSSLAGHVGILPGAELSLWPVGGIALAAGWRYGARWVLPAGAGAASTGWLTHGTAEVALTAFSASTLGALAAIAMLMRWSRTRPPTDRLQALVRFMTVALFVAAPVGATIGALTLGDLDAFARVEVFATHWLVDALGMTIVAPAVLALVGLSVRERAPDSIALTLLALTASMGIAGAAALLLDAGRPELARTASLFYLPILVWGAARMTERAHALTLFATALPVLAVQWREIPGPHLPLDGVLLVVLTAVVGLVVHAIVGDRRLAASRLSERLHGDVTTGLLTDRGMSLWLEERLSRTDRPNHGLIGLQVANFDSIQDLCDPTLVLRLEQAIAGLILRQMPGGRAARLAPGRYACLLPVDTEPEVRDLARSLYGQLNGLPCGDDAVNIRLIVDVGGLLIDGRAGATPDECLASLAEAMKLAASVHEPRLFTETLSRDRIEARQDRRRRIEHLRTAIREQRLELFAEPMSDPQAQPGQLAFEVLTRLRASDGTLVYPQAFLPLAVEVRATIDFDRGVIAQVFRWLAGNPDALARTHSCSINLFGPTISDATTPAYIREQRMRFAIPPEKIVFEITESEAIRDPDAARRLLDELRRDGFRIALDDFGTGLSSFDYLKRFPVDYLKIDGAFIRGLLETPLDEEIVMATVRVARRLGIRTVAEHVREQAIRDRLTALGVDIMQGEAIGTPMPIGELFERRARLRPVNERSERRAGSTAEGRGPLAADAGPST